jgi:hypothetical protein
MKPDPEKAPDLGDPREVRPTDPTSLTLTVSAQVLQAILAALGELPAKFSRRALDDIEGQRDRYVLAHRAQLLEKQKLADAERLAAAEARRERKAARNAARANGATKASPAPAPDPA